MTNSDPPSRPAFVPILESRLRAGLAAWGLADSPLAVLPRGVSGEVFLLHDSDGQPLVAKYAYMYRDDFEPGLLAAEVVAAAGLRAAAPRRTSAGEALVMVEWPDGVEHPLALLAYMDGDRLDPTTPSAAARVGSTLGRVQAILLHAGAKQLALSGQRDYLAYLRATTQDLGAHQWLHEHIAELVAEVDDLTSTGRLTCGPGVWDGPEIVVDDQGEAGLLDFGVVDWHPIAHPLAYGTTQVSPPDRENAGLVETFLSAFVEECPLSEVDIEAIPLFRRVTLAIYAKFMAARRASGLLDANLDARFDRMIAALQ